MKTKRIHKETNTHVQVQMKLEEFANIMFILQTFQKDYKNKLPPHMEKELFEVINEWNEQWRNC